jgi:hypothetical protein
VLGVLSLVLAIALVVAVVFLLFDDDSPDRVSATAPSSSTTAPAARDLTDAELAALYGDAVYRVDAGACEGYSGGSAFAIDPHHLVTNMHVVALDQTPEVVSRSGQRHPARVVGATFDPDVAVLEVADALPQTLEFAPASSLQEGQRIVALGFPVPEQDFAVATGGIVSFQVRDGRRTAIRTDAAVDHGNSGGPALTTRGQVVGVVTALELGTVQPLALAFSYEALGAHVRDAIEGDADNEVVDCDQIESYIDDLIEDYYDPDDLPELEPPDVAAPAPLPDAGTLPPIPGAPEPLPPSDDREPGSLPEPPEVPEAPCPTGSPTAVVDSVDAFLVSDGSDGSLPAYDAVVAGTVRNDGTAAIAVRSVDVAVNGTYGAVPGFADLGGQQLEPGGSTSFSVSVSSVESDAPPTATALADWSWADPQAVNC